MVPSSTSRPWWLRVKGKKAEFMLAKLLRRRGWFVVRGPASGARGVRFTYPDIVAVKKGRVIVGEVKLRKHVDTIHIPSRQIKVLEDAAERSGGEAYVFVWISAERKWYVFPTNTLQPQQHERGPRYVITKSMYASALTLYDLNL